MALKKDGDRTKIVLSVKKVTAEKLRQIAEKTNRPIGRTLDVILEEYSK